MLALAVLRKKRKIKKYFSEQIKTINFEDHVTHYVNQSAKSIRHNKNQ